MMLRIDLQTSEAPHGALDVRKNELCARLTALLPSLFRPSAEVYLEKGYSYTRVLATMAQFSLYVHKDGQKPHSYHLDTKRSPINQLLRIRARILVQVTVYRRLLIGLDDHLDQSEVYDILCDASVAA